MNFALAGFSGALVGVIAALLAFAFLRRQLRREPLGTLRLCIEEFTKLARVRSVVLAIADERAIAGAPPDLIEVPFTAVVQALERRDIVRDNDPGKLLLLARERLH